jgi:hypothetical protein
MEDEERMFREDEERMEEMEENEERTLGLWSI